MEVRNAAAEAQLHVLSSMELAVHVSFRSMRYQICMLVEFDQQCDLYHLGFRCDR